MEAFFDRFAKVPPLQKIGGVIALCAAIFAGYYFLVYTPQQQKMQTKQEAISVLERSLREKKETVANLAEYEDKVKRLDQNLQKAIKLLPNSAEIPSLLQKISSLAKKAGLEILTFVPNPEVPQDFYARVPVTLTLRGTFTELTSFFDAVGKLSRIVNIGNFTFTAVGGQSKDKKSSKKLLSASCTATTYRFLTMAPPPPKKEEKAPEKKDGKEPEKKDGKEPEKKDGKAPEKKEEKK